MPVALWGPGAKGIFQLAGQGSCQPWPLPLPPIREQGRLWGQPPAQGIRHFCGEWGSAVARMGLSAHEWGSGSGPVSVTRIRYSPRMAGQGHVDGDRLRSGQDVSLNVGPGSAGHMTRQGRAVAELETNTLMVSPGWGLMALD